MEIFNIGPLELVFILLLALIVLGPDEMIKTGRSIARGIRKFIRSPLWKSLLNTSQEIRELPRKLIREAGIEESMEEFSQLKRSPLEEPRIIPPKTSEETGMDEERAQEAIDESDSDTSDEDNDLTPSGDV